jgi:hypothetical protein
MTENRLELIRRWSMAGAPGAVDHDFGSPVDIHAAVGERGDEPEGTTSPAPQTVLLKPAGEDGWQPLLAEPNPA